MNWLAGAEQIAALMPHAGAMCLLDRVIRWDSNGIDCEADSHRIRPHPLARDDRLGAICGIEYAAQAMALHARLAGGARGRAASGYLASVRDVICHVEWLEDIPGCLHIHVDRLAGDADGAVYRFVIDSADGPGLQGRATVMLNAGTRDTDRVHTVRRALVTGGSGAIGSAICDRLAAAGRHVIVHANSGAARAKVVADGITARGGSAEVAVFDVTDADATRACIETLLDAGAIEVLINNAGIHSDAVLPAMRREQWSSVIEVSLNGFFNVTQPLLMAMMRGRWGRIVTITSVAGVAGNRGQTNYAAAKAGLHGATRSLALELASRGITVNAVAPGLIATPMTQAAFTVEQIAALVPMKRAGTVDEVAALVEFLASEQAGYISGQVISINGGMI